MAPHPKFSVGQTIRHNKTRDLFTISSLLPGRGFYRGTDYLGKDKYIPVADQDNYTLRVELEPRGGSLAEQMAILERTEAIKLREDATRTEAMKRADAAYAELNNLYLAIQRGEIKLNRKQYTRLNDLLGKVYPKSDSMYDWWYKEFQKLPGWINV